MSPSSQLAVSSPEPTSEAGMNVEDIPMSQILPDEDFNCRGHIIVSSVLELAEDILNKGLLYPVVVRMNSDGTLFEKNGKYYKYALVAGFRRYTAFRVNNAETIPANVKLDMPLIDARELNLRENLFRENLNILQEAKALAHWKGIKSYAEVGRMFGQSRGWAEVRFNLLEMPEEIQKETALGVFNQTDIKNLHIIPASKRLEAAREIKERKQAGKRATTPTALKHKDPWKPKVRIVGDIEAFQDEIRDKYGKGKYENLPSELKVACRFLGWCAGAVSDGEIQEDIRRLTNAKTT